MAEAKPEQPKVSPDPKPAVQPKPPTDLPAQPQPETNPGTSGLKPTIGRIVFFRHDLNDDEAAPAIITKVVDEKAGLVNLTVFINNQQPYCFSEVREGPESGQWSWPPHRGYTVTEKN